MKAEIFKPQWLLSLCIIFIFLVFFLDSVYTHPISSLGTFEGEEVFHTSTWI